MVIRTSALVLIFWMLLLSGCSKEEGKASVKETPLTDQQKTEIAAQALRGERPESDLARIIPARPRATGLRVV